MRCLICIVFLAASSVFAQVAYEAAGSGFDSGYNTGFTFSITLGSTSSTRAVMFYVNTVEATTASTTVKIGSQSASIVSSTSASGGYGNLSIWCIATSLTGSQTVTLAWTGNSNGEAGAISATGVDQTTPCNNGTETTGNGSLSRTITSTSGDLTSSVFLSSDASGTTTTNQTAKINLTDSGATIELWADIGPGTGTTTHTWTPTSGHSAAMAGANFHQASTSVNTPTISLAAGTYTANLAQSTTFATGTSGAYLCVTSCTTNACTPSTPGATSPPTCSTGTQYSANSQAITLPVGYSTYSVLGTKSGLTNSTVATSGQYNVIPTITILNGNTIGHTSGQIKSWNGGTIGGSTGNITQMNGVTISPYGTIDTDLIYTGNYSTSGTAITGAIGNSSTISNNCNPGTCATWGAPSVASTYYVGANQSACNNLGPVQLNNGGPGYAAGALNYNSVEFENQFAFWGLTTTITTTNLTMGVCATPLPTFSSGGIDLIELTDSDGYHVWGQVYPCGDGNYGFHIETSVLTTGGGSTPCVEPGNSLWPGPFLVSMNWNETSNGTGFYGTYASGGSVTGTSGQVCTVSFTGGTTGGYTILQGTNSLTGATVYGIATPGTPWVSAPTSGTLSNGPSTAGPATCSGTITISGATLGAVATISIHNASTGALIGQTQVPTGFTSGTGLNNAEIQIGNGENYAGAVTWYFQNLMATWTGTVPQDMYSAW
jgi:hypothetical protein